MIIEIVKLHENAIIPEYKTKGAAGFDFHALEGCVVKPRGRTSVKTGLAFAIPEGYELEIRSRSGLAFKHQVFAYNGTIDSDYRGEIVIMIHNDSNYLFPISAGDRIAQGIIKPIVQAEFVSVSTLDKTERGTDGFGSTGK
jgi:dUTP pyrophosphatase